MVKTVQDLIDKLDRLPKTMKVIQMRECKACYFLTEETPVRFFRLDLKEERKKRQDGYKCTKCGYLCTRT
jgi:hypothetical protein